MHTLDVQFSNATSFKIAAVYLTSDVTIIEERYPRNTEGVLLKPLTVNKLSS